MSDALGTDGMYLVAVLHVRDTRRLLGCASRDARVVIVGGVADA